MVTISQQLISLFLGNFRTSLNDATEAKNIHPRYAKAIFRGMVFSQDNFVGKCNKISFLYSHVKTTSCLKNQLLKQVKN